MTVKREEESISLNNKKKISQQIDILDTDEVRR